MKQVKLSIAAGDWQLEGQVAVSTEPTTIGAMLPIARGLSDTVVSETCRSLEESGNSISCKKGCGACCRQLVAISEVEARRLHKVLEGTPEPRRSELRNRFATAHDRLEQAGLMRRLRENDRLTDDEYLTLATEYFREKIACPFLEDESCSIYEERPITCREYLVTSPAENCAEPTADNITRVKLPLRVFNAVARWQTPPSEHFMERWVPLILAIEWAASHQEDPPPRPGTELLSELLDHLTGKTAPS
ncbi:MAG TPA: YkgJ family cysteine cluster protein [Pyrinomonadaceae bacterium]|nr:YkgJ family cysteine cluster protein [Pyrinomonadaceae bacterium]